MLLLTKEHHIQGGEDNFLGSQSRFLTTSRLLQLFSADVRSPTEAMRVIYIDGAWDLFHPGHVAILKAARKVSQSIDSLIFWGLLWNTRRRANGCESEATILLLEFTVTLSSTNEEV